MPDYGRDLLFGAFITPVAAPARQAVELAVTAETAGLDLAAFQDHPYQPRFLDTWTLMSYAAARTSRIRLLPDVLNLPLRQPVVVARSAASLDLLSDGRLELGLGTGAFWDAIVAAGGQRLSPGDAVTGLEEAIRIIRGVWDTAETAPLRMEGKIHQVHGAKRGPAPAHDVGIWLGAYKPRMLRLTGAEADGWLPSLGYLRGGPADLVPLNAAIDDGAASVGRDPAAVRRLLNISGSFEPTGRGLLQGPVAQWAEELAEMAVEYGISGFVLASDDAGSITRFGTEVAPAVRELVADARLSRTG
ncbi:LLM class flavin-dependent oxidoreductase [Arthrobacter sp. NPDC055585]